MGKSGQTVAQLGDGEARNQEQLGHFWQRSPSEACDGERLAEELSRGVMLKGSV